MALRRGSGRGGDRVSPRRGRDRDRDDRDDRGRGRGGRGGRGGGGSRRFQYHSRGADSARARASQSGGDRDSFLKPEFPTYSPHDGANSIRILPPTWDEPDHFGMDIYVNYGVGADNHQYLSLSRMYDEDDPIDEERQRAVDDDDKEYADSLKPRKRCLVWLIDRKNEDQGPQLWAMPWTVDRDICAAMSDEDTNEVLEIDHPEDGYDVKFHKDGQGRNTKYTGVKVARNSSALGKGREAEEWLDFVQDNPVPDTLLSFDYDHIAKAFSGGGRDKDDDDDRDRGRGRGRGRDDDRGSSGPDWDDIHGLTFREMKRLIKDEDLDLDADDFENDTDLADEICDLMGVEESRHRGRDRDDDDGGRGRMRNMRR